ncbi:amino acid ABC transporter permease [Effusibacillus lacus]|uniref:Amino acid ABC transporter permease n=1 Tax=Effusibacillus lacus TaxID=1348429 RepID=A0A292YMR6_9BACL|nr:amino acid ABC transporter permease [Effusibacillus lacus]TCS67860.1 polar amino acid transport system permease protein [Effusibacillus lacus]GAX89684.1 amino acid ABC transporter permease [Effusibacillus lacus]
MNVRWDIIVEYMPMYLDGAKMTLQVTVIAVLLGTLLGLFAGIGRLAEAKHGLTKYLLMIFVRWPAVLYITFFRGTPLFVQILIVHFGLMPILIHPADGLLISGDLARQIKLSEEGIFSGVFISGVVALTLNSGAYIAEIFRAGIQSIDRGQTEAARSLGLTYGQTMRYVIVPQAFRRMLPPLGNEAIMLLKDSSLVSAIGLAELAYMARSAFGTTTRVWEPYLTISLMYLVMTLGLSILVEWLERRYGKGD